MTGEKIKIAIIDDEQDLCFLLSDILTGNGFDVKSYYTLQDGINGLELTKPDWVVLDNDLPDGLGWQKTDEIRNMLPEVSIIKISANPDSHRTLYKSNVFYLIKPINVDSIISLINNTRAAS